MSAKVVSVIEATEKRGDGTSENPVRLVTQYYSFDGELLAERDICSPEIAGNHGVKALLEERNRCLKIITDRMNDEISPTACGVLERVRKSIKNGLPASYYVAPVVSETIQEDE